MSTILSLSSCWLNNLVIPVMAPNSEPQSRGVPFWSFVGIVKFPLKASKIFLYWHVTSCLCLKENIGRPSFLTSCLIIFLIVIKFLGKTFCNHPNNPTNLNLQPKLNLLQSKQLCSQQTAQSYSFIIIASSPTIIFRIIQSLPESVYPTIFIMNH